MRSRFAVACTAVILLATFVSTAFATSADAKGCKHGTLPFMVAKKKLCLPTSKLTDANADTDPRLAQLRGLFALPTAKFPAKRGKKHPPSFAAALKRGGVSSQKTLDKKLAALLKQLDSKGKAKTKLKGGALLAGTETASGVSFELTSGGTVTKFGITSASAKTSSQRSARAAETPGFGVSVPQCPSQFGEVWAKGDHYLDTSSSAWFSQKDFLIVRAGVESKIQAIGFVGDDAKLDHLQIDQDYKIDIHLTGPDFGKSIPPVIDVSGQRTRIVNMRSPNYSYDDLGNMSTLNLKSKLAKLNLALPVADAVNTLLETDAATTYAHMIKLYRQAEKYWNVPNACAHLSFDPAAYPFKMHEGDSGQADALLTAYNGQPVPAGTIKPATQVGTLKLLTSETSPTGDLRFQWTAGAKFGKYVVYSEMPVVSRAGVAREDWQVFGDVPLYIRVNITLEERDTRAGCGDIHASATLTGSTNALDDSAPDETTTGFAAVTGGTASIISDPSDNPACEEWRGEYGSLYNLSFTALNDGTGALAYGPVNIFDGTADGNVFGIGHTVPLEPGTTEDESDLIGAHAASYQHYVIHVLDVSGNPLN